MKRLFIIALLLVSTAMTAEVNIPEITEILKQVETNHNPKALGDYNEDGIPLSYGILQIKQIAIDDVNRRYKTYYKHSDAFIVECAEEIFELYTGMWANHLEKKEGRKATAEDIVRIWNGGPNGYKRKSTIGYLLKYKNYRYLWKTKTWEIIEDFAQSKVLRA